MDRAFQRSRSLMLCGTFYSVPPRMIHDKWGYEDIYQSSDNKEENKKRSFWKILFSKM